MDTTFFHNNFYVPVESIPLRGLQTRLGWVNTAKSAYFHQQNRYNVETTLLSFPRYNDLLGENSDSGRLIGSRKWAFDWYKFR